MHRGFEGGDDLFVTHLAGFAANTSFLALLAPRHTGD
jgi:hypothetical protein